MGRILSISFLLVFNIIASYAIKLDDVRFHCDADSIKINKLLVDGAEFSDSTYNFLANYYAMQLLETPYVANTLNGDNEMLTINIDELDCTTFLETLIALTITTKDGKTNWLDYANNLESIRYRSGVMNGYASRLHYISDWAINNRMRGNIKEVTNDISKSSSKVLTINFMSRNRELYPALSNDSVYNRIVTIEENFKVYKMPIIEKKYLSMESVWSSLREGDLIALTTNIKGLDVSHVGIIHIVDGKPHLLHASSLKGRVIIDPLTISDMLSRSKNSGIRVFRIINE